MKTGILSQHMEGTARGLMKSEKGEQNAIINGFVYVNYSINQWHLVINDRGHSSPELKNGLTDGWTDSKTEDDEEWISF